MNFRDQLAAMLNDLTPEDVRPSVQIVENAVAFVSRLPDEMSYPEVGLDPDGDISLDWMSTHGIFTVSIGAIHETAPYAMNLSGLSAHGVAPIEDILRELKDYLRVLTELEAVQGV